MKIKILTLFPEMIAPVIHQSILGRAIQAGYIDVEIVNIRDYSQNKHKNTDDYPFGGGAGMVMTPQPVMDAIRDHADAGTRRIYMSPRGRVFTQKIAEEYAKYDSLLFLCGHSEGVDQRALDACIDEELSIGDYVLTGGELGALVAIDAVSRLIPGVLGSEESSADESFTMGLLEYPQYTRPAEYEGMRVPDVLLGGNHRDICAWRREEALKITRERRPDLFAAANLTEDDRTSLARMDFADRIIAELNTLGIYAARMEFFAEKQYAKNWFSRILPTETQSTAKRSCLSSKRHIGFLYRAFTEGYAQTCDSAEVRGRAILYFDREQVGLQIDHAERVSPEFLQAYPCTLLTTADYSVCIASQKRCELPLVYYRSRQV